MAKRFASHTDDEIFKKGSKVYSNSDQKGSKFTTDLTALEFGRTLHVLLINLTALYSIYGQNQMCATSRALTS
jgi:hypothetical protein